MSTSSEAANKRFDEEAEKVFEWLNLHPEKSHRYNPLDPIWEHPESKARVYVGNQQAAKSLATLTSLNIRAVVNCTDSMAFYHSSNETFRYFRFNISAWMSSLKQPYKLTDFHAFFSPVWAFIEDALENGISVLIHCLAGAHRAGTTGVAWLMYKNRISSAQAIAVAKQCRPLINPIGLLKQLITNYDKAIGDSVNSVDS